MPWIAGVDGCRAGWIVVRVEDSTFQLRRPDVQLCASFAEVLGFVPVPAVIAVDMPIGLLAAPQPGGRACDRQARQLLGRRASSVFSPPGRNILEATRYEHVRPHGISRQAFNIMPKIREVDRLLKPTLQQTVYEAHPELAFMLLAGHPMQHNKKTAAGQNERLRALAGKLEMPFRHVKSVFESTINRFRRTQVAPDDVLDACVLVRTAWRIANAQARRVPALPPVDKRGLRMAIWF